MAKGKNNFSCAVKDDFIRNGTYRCGSCASNNPNECYHTTADYGPCMSNEDFGSRNCKYRTFPEHYKVEDKGTREEKVFIDYNAKNDYQSEYSEWMHLKNFEDQRKAWISCEYYHQLNIALTSSHSIFNYSNFLAFLPNKRKILRRNLLILDEVHLLETEIVRFREISISKRRWKRFFRNFKIVDHGYHDIERWIDFLIDLETRMLVLTGNEYMVEELSWFRRMKYDWISKKDSPNNKRVVGASDLFESDEEIAEKYDTYSFRGFSIGEELAVEVIRDMKRLTGDIDNILSNPKNWVVSEIKKEGYEVIGVELKPLNVSPYCKDIFERCNKTLMMSATILDSRTVCRSLGLAYDEVKFIRIESDFPLQNRPIYPLNIAYLNYNNVRKQEVQANIAHLHVDSLANYVVICTYVWQSTRYFLPI